MVYYYQSAENIWNQQQQLIDPLNASWPEYNQHFADSLYVVVDAPP